MAIDLHRFWNRHLPQTLLSALWLLYLRAVFDLLDFLQDTDRVGITTHYKGGLGALVWLVVIAGAVAAGYFLSQEKKIGYYIAIAVSLAPFLINFWVSLDSRVRGLSFIQRFTLGDLGQFNTLLWLMFTVALVVLLLHPMSRDYVRVWFK